MRRGDLPASAPRGKEFIVRHFVTPIGPGVQRDVPGSFDRLADAERTASRIDDRLSPYVVLVDKAPR